MLDGVVTDDASVLNARLEEGERFYKLRAPHGPLDGQTPMSGCGSIRKPRCKQRLSVAHPKRERPPLTEVRHPGLSVSLRNSHARK
jgi:hypothetical protein